MKSIFTAVLLFTVLSLPSYGYDWATNPGDGSTENPYQISEPNQLIAVGSDPNLLDKCFILTSDIVFDPNNPGHIFIKALIAPNLNPGGMSYLGSPFTGTFDGYNHNIKNLTIEADTDYIGLFGFVENAIIKNLVLSNISISCDWNYAGGLAGYSTLSSFTACHVSGTVSGAYYVGGLLGYNLSGSLVNCSAIVFITADSRTGGLIGNNTGSLFACYAAGSVTNSFTRAGGLVGHNDGSLTACYATDSVNSAYSAGGLVGVNTGPLSACYSTGSVSATSDVGGFLGYHELGSISSCYFLDTAGPDNGYGTPLTYLEMIQRASYAGWDFVDDGTDGPSNIWRMCKDYVDYPHLSWEISQYGDYACPDGVWLEDLEELAFQWLTDDGSPDFNYAADGFGDGQINNDDMEILSEYWLADVPPFLVPCNETVSVSVYEDGPNPSPVPFCLLNTGRKDGDFMLDYLPTQPAWLDITPSQGTAPAGGGVPLSIAIDVVGPDLAPGQYEQQVQILTGDVENIPVFTVYLEVINRFPIPAVDENELWFSTDEGGPNPAPQSVILSNTGTENMDYLIDYPGGQPAWLDVSPSAGTVNKNSQTTLTVSIDVVSGPLAPGEYSQDFQIVDQSGQADPLTVTVNLEVIDLVPILSLSASSLSFAADAGGPNPSSKWVLVENIGQQESNFTLYYPGGQPGWLSVSPGSGSLPVGYATLLSVSVDVIGPALPAGTYTSTFEVRDPEDPFSPHPVTVVLTVHP